MKLVQSSSTQSLQSPQRPQLCTFPFSINCLQLSLTPDQRSSYCIFTFSIAFAGRHFFKELHESSLSIIIMSSALTSLVNWLTRPLVPVFPTTTVITLQLLLEANLAPLFPGDAPGRAFTFAFSMKSLPPTPIYSACVDAGLSWADWAPLFGGPDLHFFVSAKRIQVALTPVLSETSAALTIWSQDVEQATETLAISKSKLSVQAVTGRRLQATLDSARARRSFLAAENIIKLPSLLPCTSQTHVDMDTDSDSDSESTTSSRFSSNSSSSDSMTSVSSASSSPASSSCDLPSTFASKVSFVRTAPSPPVEEPCQSIPPRLLSRAQRRLAVSTVDHSKTDLQKYLYQGGSTGVITGGVMLGGVKPSKPTKVSTRSTRGTRKPLLLGPDCENWRV